MMSTSPRRSAGMLVVRLQLQQHDLDVRVRARQPGHRRHGQGVDRALERRQPHRPAGSSPSRAAPPRRRPCWSRISRARRARISPAAVSRTRRPVRSSSWRAGLRFQHGELLRHADGLRLARCGDGPDGAVRCPDRLSSRSRQGFMTMAPLYGSTEQQPRICEMDVTLGGVPTVGDMADFWTRRRPAPGPLLRAHGGGFTPEIIERGRGQLRLHRRRAGGSSTSPRAR